MRQSVIPGLALASFVATWPLGAAGATLEAQFNNYWTGTVVAFVRPSTERDVARYGKVTIMPPQPPVVSASGTNTYVLGFAYQDSPTTTYCEFAVDVGYLSTGGTLSLSSCLVRTNKAGSGGAMCSTSLQLDYVMRKCVASIDVR